MDLVEAGNAVRTADESAAFASEAAVFPEAEGAALVPAASEMRRLPMLASWGGAFRSFYTLAEWFPGPSTSE